MMHVGLSLLVFTRATLASAGISYRRVSVCLCLSVRPSVTSRCSTEPANHSISQTTSQDSAGTLVSNAEKKFGETQTESPQRSHPTNVPAGVG